MRPLLACLVFLLLAAGCLGPGPAAPGTSSGPATSAPTHPTLAGVVEPAEFLAPTFGAPALVAAGSAAYSAGEPGIAAARDGSLYVSFPGCDEGTSLLLTLPGEESCGDGMVWKSLDSGQSWTRLNSRPDGRLDPEAPAANGDADVTVDSAGNLYASNLGGGGIQFLRSLDGGATWKNMANIVPPTEDKTDDPSVREGADRQWLAAAGPGHVINAWMRTSPSRDVRLNTTFDGGQTWVGNLTFGENIGWLGTVAFAPDGRHAYVPYTQPTGASPGGVGLGVGDHFVMHVLRTADGGVTWEDIDTGMEWDTSVAGAHWSGGYMAPAIDVTGDGMVVVAMAVDRTSVLGLPTPILMTEGTKILVRMSRDNGTTWGETNAFIENPLGDGPEIVPGTRIFPWIAGGAGDRFAITYLSAPTPLQSDYAGTLWSVEAMVFDGAAEGELRTHEVLVQANVHEGPICARGGLCAFPVDRTLLDYFECDILADGRLAVVYAADSATVAKALEIRVAVQDGGSLLFERPAQG